MTPDPARPDWQEVRRVLPDGCIDIVVEFDGGTDEAGGRIVPCSADRLSVVGTMSRPLIVNAPNSCFLGVRFKPGKAIGFLGVSAGELTDQSIPLSQLWSHIADRFEGDLTDQPTVAAKLALMDALLLDRLKVNNDDDLYVEALVDLIQRRQGAVSIQTLSEFAGISRQHIARKFDRYLGISPKLFSRIVRFQDLIKKIRLSPSVDWATTALDLGYYDQAHMISDFKEFSGQTPASFATTIL
jgi:AraC-like DNA-binding protein